MAARGRFIVLCGSSGCFTYEVDNTGFFTARSFGYTSLPSLSVDSPIAHVGQKSLNFGGKIEVPSEPFWDGGLGSYRVQFDVTWMVGVRLGNAIRNVWTPLVLATASGSNVAGPLSTDLAKVPHDWVGTIFGTITLPAVATPMIRWKSTGRSEMKHSVPGVYADGGGTGDGH